MKKSELRKIIKEEIQNVQESKQPGILYHFTDDSGMEGILIGNQLLASINVGGISLTRDKNGWFVGRLDNIFRIELDGNKISNNYKIKPVAWGQNDRSKGYTESEELVITPKINNIKNYILSVTINKDMLRSLGGVEVDYIIDLLGSRSIPFNYFPQ